jgi:hypothetical protein
MRHGAAMLSSRTTSNWRVATSRCARAVTRAAGGSAASEAVAPRTPSPVLLAVAEYQPPTRRRDHLGMHSRMAPPRVAADCGQVNAARTTRARAGRGSVRSCRAIRCSSSPSKQAATAIEAVCGSRAPSRARATTLRASIAARPRESASRSSALWLASMKKTRRAAVTVRFVVVMWSNSAQSASTSSSEELGENGTSTGAVRVRGCR